MNFSAEQIAGILEGQIEGNAQVEVSNIAKIEEATPKDLTFLANPRYANFIYSSQAGIVIVNHDFIAEKEISATLIRVADAYKAFSKLLEFYNKVKLMKSGIDQNTFIHADATYGQDFYLGHFSSIGKHVNIGHNVKIYPNCTIGDNVIIGDNTIIFSGVRIYSETVIGTQCVIHGGTIIGSDGFGFAPSEDGTYNKVPQIGNVIIEDHVEIGACTTIDRATLGSTIIRKGVKLDNQIQVAHNVEIGENTVIASQTGIAGSTKIGKNCLIGGQVGIVGHITIGNNVKIQAQSGIGKSLKDGEVVQGSPAFNYSDFSKSLIYFKNLPKLASDIENIKKRL
jgi:UDP-3-O-[3-hydroxymyristoyl] glucosamine N-acyltransferase